MTIALTVAGLALSAAGAVASGVAQSNQAKYQAAVAKANANIAERNARAALDESQKQQQQQDTQNLALIGQQEAAQGASGAAYEGRSFALTRKSTKQLARQDALNIRQQGVYNAEAFRQQKLNYTNQASAYKSAASNSLVSGFIGGASSLIGGAVKSRSLLA